MADMWRYTMVLHETNGRPFSIAGTGLTDLEAKNELIAKAAMTVGVADRVSFAGPVAPGTIDNSTSNVYSDAVLVLRNNAGDIASVHLENIDANLAIGLGQIDLTDPLIVAFATAYRDGRGLGGYVPFGGEYVA